MWIDTYKPKTIDDMILSEDLKTFFKSYLEKNDIPNMLLSGRAGVGKTTIAKILSSSIPDADVLYINASDDNGIDTVRTTIKSFVEAESMGLKIVILDEADGLTDSAQKGLRNIIETDIKDSRFILTCNYPNKIIEPILSRCPLINLEFSFKDITDKIIPILKELNYCNKENITTVTKIIKTSYPDIRRIFHLIERFCTTGSIELNKQLAYEKHIDLFDKLLNCTTFNEVYKCREEWLRQEQSFAADYIQLAGFIHDYINNCGISDIKKSKCLIKTAEHQWRMSMVADKEIQFHALILSLMEIVHGKG